MAQLMSLVLMALGAFGLWWLYGRQRALPDPAAAGRPSSEGRP
jgi:phosphatidylglycerol:prolipoprotein diacylglycerol transferase